MENNKEISICCSSVTHIDMNGKFVKEHFASTDNNVLVAELLFNSRICTPSTIIKAEVLRTLGGFPEMRNAEDYCLFLQLASRGYKFGGVDVSLVKYRINTNSLTRKYRAQQLELAEDCSFKYASSLVGGLDRDSFKRFWYFLALEGDSNFLLNDLVKLDNLICFINRDDNYRNAWLGIFRWISVRTFERKKTLSSLLIAAYFKYGINFRS
jgi:hypothetical protein